MYITKGKTRLKSTSYAFMEVARVSAALRVVSIACRVCDLFCLRGAALRSRSSRCSGGAKTGSWASVCRCTGLHPQFTKTHKIHASVSLSASFELFSYLEKCHTHGPEREIYPEVRGGSERSCVSRSAGQGSPG